MKEVKLLLGDNIESLKTLADNSIDSVVTDPPYGLSFMNKKWDYDVPSVNFWKEVYRVLKPGGHILSFGGTRTYHRMVVNMEDAGFEIRDQIMWLYGSGFPKSHNIGKAVDKLQGNEREIVKNGLDYGHSKKEDDGSGKYGFKPEYKITKGQSEFEGWGTALKPANEPICLARKPLSEKSVAENVLKWRTGGINIDGCRVGSETITINRHNLENISGTGMGQSKEIKWAGESVENEGRFPANLILECCCDEVIKGEKGEIKKSSGRIRENHEYNSVGNMGSYNGEGTIDNYNDKGDIHTNPMCPCYIMDEQSGVSKSSSNKWQGENNAAIYGKYEKGIRQSTFSDKGGASRFFYQAKVSKKERNLGLDGFEEKQMTLTEGKGRTYNDRCANCKKKFIGPDDKICSCENPETDKTIYVQKNNHPTVKPINLMSYLCRLITPEGGTVLDPFMGSGSTGIAARLEGFNFIGMEMSEDYYKIAEARINSFREYKKFTKK